MTTVSSQPRLQDHRRSLLHLEPIKMIDKVSWKNPNSINLPLIDINDTSLTSPRGDSGSHFDHSSLTGSSVSFAGNSLVDAPRLILSENTTIQRTMLNSPNPLQAALGAFYDNVVYVSSDVIEETHDEVTSLMDYILPRTKKLGNASGMKIRGIVYTGRLFDNTQIIESNDVHVLILFDRFKTKVDSLEGGYKMIPLRRYRQREGQKPDQWRYGRSQQGNYLSPIETSQNMYELVKRALLMKPEVRVEDMIIADGAAPIRVSLPSGIRVHITPACDGDRACYITARPFWYDRNPASDMVWRCDYTVKQRKILRAIDQADRGVRHQAYLLLMGFVRCEPTLQALTDDQITAVMLHWCDDVVDTSPRWQRSQLEECFLGLLQKLRDFLSNRYLPQFFCRDQNMLADMPMHTIERLRTRVAYLCSDKVEIVRVLTKRTKQWMEKD